MATVHLESGRRLHGSAEVGRHLAAQGIVAHRWPVPPALQPLRGQATLPDEDKAQVLKGYKKRLDEEARERGYVQADLVVLNPSTLNLDELLAKFDKTHYHDDDEVRYIFDGEGIFGFEPSQEPPFSVTVTGGDYIIVPAKTYHWFTLTDSRSIKAIRLFKDTSGWVPHYKA